MLTRALFSLLLCAALPATALGAESPEALLAEQPGWLSPQRHGAHYAALARAAAVAAEVVADAAPGQQLAPGHGWLRSRGVHDATVEVWVHRGERPTPALKRFVDRRIKGRRLNSYGLARRGEVTAVVFAHHEVAVRLPGDCAADPLVFGAVPVKSGLKLSRSWLETADGRYLGLPLPEDRNVSVAAGDARGALLEVMVDSPGGPRPAALVRLCGSSDSRPALRARRERPDAVSSALEGQLLHALNAARARRKAGALQRHRRLDDVARRHAAVLAQRRRLAHVVPELGALPDRLLAAGYGFRAARENLVAAPDIDGLVERVLSSPAHARNVFVGDDFRVGIGITKGQMGGEAVLYAVQVFAQPSRSTRRPRPLVRRALDALNADRKKRGLAPLAPQPFLDFLARRLSRRKASDDDWDRVARSLRAAEVEIGRLELGRERGRDPAGRLGRHEALLEKGLTHAGMGLSEKGERLELVWIAAELPSPEFRR